jgi:hypothetical protein
MKSQEQCKVLLKDLKFNPENPRTISNTEMESLKEKIRTLKNFKDIIIDEKNMIIGGDKRVHAMLEMGIEEPIHATRLIGYTKKEKKAVNLLDNMHSGIFDQPKLNAWRDDVEEMGFFDSLYKSQNKYTKKIDAPIYHPKNKKPELKELINNEKTNQLIKEINNSDIDQSIKNFLIQSSYRHIVFNYAKIADYYAHSEKKVQELMEKSALVIIDFKQALENGYVKLSEEIRNQYLEEHGK